MLPSSVSSVQRKRMTATSYLPRDKKIGGSYVCDSRPLNLSFLSNVNVKVKDDIV